MYDSHELRTMLFNPETDFVAEKQPENIMKAYILAYRIQEQESFAEYFNKSDAKTPTPLVLDYMRHMEAPAISTIAAANIREVLFEDINRNHSKTALLRGVAQAYFDLCLFLGIASICTNQRDLSYGKSIYLVNKSLEQMEKGHQKVCDSLSPIKWTDEYDYFNEIANGVISFSRLKEIFEQAQVTIQLYKSNRIKYNLSHGSVIEISQGYMEADRWMKENNKYFAFALTVMKHLDAADYLRDYCKSLLKSVSKSEKFKSFFNEKEVVDLSFKQLKKWRESTEIPDYILN